ncbi:MAG: lipid-A-disaccharide synthase [Bacteroidia bacterium]|nr:lipid-A-disaccharide synthase [Bacteroidia bacterium]MDW8134621.1 lipid-A-disaccharide synthase [Bacteroidia bacterium]
MRLYWVVGELSGEYNALPVIEALKAKLAGLEMRGMGGSAMAKAGVSLVASWEKYTVVGFIEVLRNLHHFIALYKRIKKDILSWKPHRLILVDFPGFNLRLARWAVRHRIPVTYFIPPQLWAWNPKRVRYLRDPMIQLLCILPFEPAFYATHGIEAIYVGHPLVNRLQAVKPLEARKPYIALLPGSRLHEVKHMLPVMAALPPFFPEWEFYVSQVAHLPKEIYDELAPDLPKIIGNTPALLKGAAAAVVTSGTATLEAALLGCPSVVVYKGNFLSYWIARQLVRVSYISLPNLILNEPVFPELIQDACKPETVANNLRYILSHREEIQNRLGHLLPLLGENNAAEKAAECIAHALHQRAVF